MPRHDEHTNQQPHRQQHQQRQMEDQVLAAAAQVDPTDHSVAAQQLRETAEMIREHREIAARQAESVSGRSADPQRRYARTIPPAELPGVDAAHGPADQPMLRAAAHAYRAMTPERVATVRAALAEVPGSFTAADLDRWGITRDEVGLVSMADLGEFDHLDTPAAGEGAGEGADPARTDPWRAPVADPWQHSAENDASVNDASVDQQLMEQRWADEYGGPWDDPRADAAHREVEGVGGRAGRDPASIRFDDPDLELCDDEPSPAHHDTVNHDTVNQGAAGAEYLDTTTRTQNALDRAEATCRRIDALAAEHDRAADQARAAELSRRHAADRELAGREVTDVRAMEVP